MQPGDITKEERWKYIMPLPSSFDEEFFRLADIDVGEIDLAEELPWCAPLAVLINQAGFETTMFVKLLTHLHVIQIHTT